MHAAPVGHHRGQRTIFLVALGIRVGLAAAHLMHPIAVLPAIDHVQDVARLRFKPLNLARLPVARNNPEARRDIAMERQDAMLGFFQQLDVVEQRQIVQDRIVRGQSEIMRRARPRNINADIVLQFACRAGHAIAHVGWRITVTEEEQFACGGIDLAVRRQIMPELAAKRFLAARRERQRIDVVGLAGHVEQRQQFAGVIDDVGIRRVLDRRTRQREIVRPGQPRPDIHLGDVFNHE